MTYIIPHLHLEIKNNDPYIVSTLNRIPYLKSRELDILRGYLAVYNTNLLNNGENILWWGSLRR